MDMIVRIIRLPLTVKGITVPDESGNYNIYINKDLSHETQVDTYIHELNHIENDDFYADKPISVIEKKT